MICLEAQLQTFEYDGHTLSWEEHSPGDHTLLFIHGWSVGRASWKPVLKYFSDMGRCVTIDLPGHYPATVPLEYYDLSQEQLIAMETAAVKHICGDQPVTIIGHSAGGLSALGIAKQLPYQVKRVVSINSVVWGQFTGIVKTALWMINNNLYSSFKSVWDFILEDPWNMMNGLSFFVHKQDAFWSNPIAWNVCRDVYAWYHLHSLHNLTVFLQMLGRCDIRSLINALSVPVLVIVGEKDPVVEPAQSYWLVDHLPNTTLRVFEETGHIPQIEAPVTFEHVVRDWLEQTKDTC